MNKKSLIKLLAILITLSSINFKLNLKAQTWKTLGSGANKPVYSLKQFDDGLIIGGNFTVIDAKSSACLAYYKKDPSYYYWSNVMDNNFNSSAMISNISSVEILAIEKINNARVHIGGEFYHPYYSDAVNVGYLQYNYSNKYNFNIYYTRPNAPVRSLRLYEDKLFIGGDFTGFGTASYIASIDTNDYSAPYPHSVGDGLNNRVYCLEIHNGDLYAGGSFTKSGNNTVNHIAKWNGSTWEALGNGVNGTICSMISYNGELIVGGNFSTAGNTAVNHIAKWNGSTWEALSNGLSAIFNSCVYALEIYDNKLFAGGNFTESGSTVLNNIAYWNNSSWIAIGSGTNDYVRCMEVFDNKLFVGGDFTSVNGITANHIAYIENSVGVKESDRNATDITIHSYPLKDGISINFPETIKQANIKLYNISGHLIYQNYCNENSLKIDMFQQPKGLYFLQVIFDKGIIAKKIIHQ